MILQIQPIFLSLLLLPVLLLLSAEEAAAAGAISLGSTLYASDTTKTWPSPTSTFSLGFLPQSSDSFIAAIFYSGGVPAIWTAGSTPVDSAASLQFLSNGNLRLLNGADQTVWDSGTASAGVTSASLSESGELVLLRNGTDPVWSSFHHPTDTVVPSQNFTASMVLQSGLYSFRLDNVTGNRTLHWNNTIVYYNQGLNSSFDSNLTSPSLGIQNIGIVSIFDPKLPVGGAFVAYSNDYAENRDTLRYLRLADDGNLRIYSSDRGSGTSVIRWAAVEDQCQVFGYCGSMGICSYNDTSPICECPSQNFELVDPEDSRKGCKRKVEIKDCPGNATMLDMENTLFLTYPPETESQTFSIGISGCRSNCLVSSTCDASTTLSDGTGTCYLKTPGFVSGYQSPGMPSISFIKVCSPVVLGSNPPLASPSAQVGRKRSGLGMQPWRVPLVVIGSILALVALVGSLCWWCCRNSPKAQHALLKYAPGAPVQFTYKELQRSTQGFREKLGEGGFGAVYRGILANKTVVAVKQLEGIEQGEKQFRMEVSTISSTHHLNLVRLIGFCSEGRHRLLVYEFMENGSLDNYLFQSEESEKLLNWEYRFNVALGTARVITYLHEECRDCIVHCDIKPENILLDENCTAKVSDFGLAKLINQKDQRYRTLTGVRGTRGYLAPEWLANLPITSKSDIYSYGMVLLEIVSGRRNFEVSAETNWKKFLVWAYEEFEKGNVKGILDRRVADQEVDMEQVARAIQVSFWCTQEQPLQRPMMGKVVQMLEGITEIEKPPAPKAMADWSFNMTSMNVSSNSGESTRVY